MAQASAPQQRACGVGVGVARVLVRVSAPGQAGPRDHELSDAFYRGRPAAAVCRHSYPQPAPTNRPPLNSRRPAARLRPEWDPAPAPARSISGVAVERLRVKGEGRTLARRFTPPYSTIAPIPPARRRDPPPSPSVARCRQTVSTPCTPSTPPP